MDSTKVTHSMKLQKWTGIVHECRNSGIPTRQWLPEHDISRDTYYYWHRKLQDVCVNGLIRRRSLYDYALMVTLWLRACNTNHSCALSPFARGQLHSPDFLV